ncbi:O-antigen polysaccharide polymerase Wzy family protein [Ornithinimicrobium cryptoxanthini]|uniref:O-antigen polysaccharide polymerase Wzy family protein n=1 Tax=Ornithinimicrobium cryptoxanthini TaxID=2934161 RepID=UPI0021195455|nr:O-antigen polysaccharide polymerase Wzy family protein [Ornithinimicrobium cryptoxanthini]
MTGGVLRSLALAGACVWPVAIIIGVVLQQPQVLVLAVVLGLLVLLALVAVLPYRHYLLGLFVASFAVFLLSRHLLNLFWPGTDAVDSLLVRWTPALETHVLLCLNLALLGLGTGAIVTGHLLRQWTGRTATAYDTVVEGVSGDGATVRPAQGELVATVRQVGLVLLAVTIPARLIYLAGVAQFVHEGSFYDLYGVDRPETVGVPGTRMLGDMSDVAVMAVLATRPSPRLTRLVLGAYFVEGLVSLATLQRASFFLNLLLIVVYLVYREATRAPDEAPWLPRWIVLAAVAALPAMTALSQTLVEQRGRTAGRQLGDPIREFLSAQGVSVNVIAFTEQFADDIPDRRWYSLGPIIEFIRYRVLALFTGETQITGNTPERALDGNLFSHTVSYLAMPEVYVRGSGYGSSFVAELYVDLGYLGVLLGSVFIGALTVGLTAMLGRGLVTRIVALLMIRQLFFIPRGSFSGFLTNAFDLYNLIALTGLAIGTWLLVSHRSRRRAPVLMGTGPGGSGGGPGQGEPARGGPARVGSRPTVRAGS